MADENTQRLHDRIDDVIEDIGEQTAAAASLNTLVRQHIVEQKGLQAKIDAALTDNEKRLRKLEEWRAARDATLPQRLMPAEDIERWLTAQDKKIETISHTLARWAAYGACALIGAQVLLQAVLMPLGRALWVWAFGG